MNLDDYATAWRAGGPATPQTTVDALIRDLTKSERRGRAMLAVCGVWSGLAAAFTAGTLLSREAIAWNEAGPALALQVVLTFALVVLIRRHMARRESLRRAGLPVRDAAQAGLDSVKHRIRDQRVFLAAAGVSVSAFAWIVNELIASGKMDARAAWSFGALCAAVLLVNAIVQWNRYHRTLAPQRRRFEQVLDALREEAGAR